MLKVLEQLNSEPRVVLENINDKLFRDGFQSYGSNSLAKHSSGDAGSGGNMQRYVIKKHSDPSTSASLNLTLVGTGVPAPVKRKTSLEQALSDADGAYQRPKKSKKGEKLQSASGQSLAKSKANQAERLRAEKQKGSDSDSKSTKGDKTLKRRKGNTSRSINEPASPASTVGSDLDSHPVASLHKKETYQEKKQKKILGKRNSISSNSEKEPPVKSPVKSAEQDISHSSEPLEAPKSSRNSDFDETMELPRPDSAMTVALDDVGQPVLVTDQDDLTEPGGDVANLNDFSVGEAPASEEIGELATDGEDLQPENVTENDAPIPQIVESFTLANDDDAAGDAADVQSPVSEQRNPGEIESPGAVVDCGPETAVAAEEVVESTPLVIEEENALLMAGDAEEVPLAQPEGGNQEKEVAQSAEADEAADSVDPMGTDSIPEAENGVVQGTSLQPLETAAVADPVGNANNEATAEGSETSNAAAVVVETMESRDEPPVSTSNPATTEPMEVEPEAGSSTSLKRKYCIIYRDLQLDSLDREEEETRQALQAVDAVLLDLKRSRRMQINETKRLRGKASVHEKEMAIRRDSLPALKDRVKQLADKESAHVEERNRRACAAKEAHEKVFQTEIKLRELQLEICKKKLKTVVDMEKNEEKPEVLAIRKQEEEATELSREVEWANVVLREAETSRLAAEEQLNGSREEHGSARKKLDEAVKAMEVVEKELQGGNAEIEQSVARLLEMDEKWKAKNLEKVNLEEALVRVETCRKFIHYDVQRAKFSRLSNPELESSDSEMDEKAEEKPVPDANKPVVAMVRASEENSSAAASGSGSAVGAVTRIHQRPARMSLDDPALAPSSARPSVSSSPAHAERNPSVPQKSPSLIDSLAVRNVPASSSNNLTPAPFAHSPDDLSQSSISTVIPFYAQLVRGTSPPVLKDESTLCREVLVNCAQYIRYCRTTQTAPVLDQKAHHNKCATMMKDFLIPFYHLLVTKNKENPVPWSVKEMLDFVQNKANEANYYDIPEPRPSSKVLDYHLKRAVEFAVKWKDKSFTSSASSGPVNTVTFSPATGTQLPTYTIHPAPPAPQSIRSPSGTQQPTQVTKAIAESSVPTAASSSVSPMNALNSMITNQSRMHSSAAAGANGDEAGMNRSRQQQVAERQFSSAFHAPGVALGSVSNAPTLQAVLHQQRPILQVQPLPTSAWPMTRSHVTFIQQNRFHYIPPVQSPQQQAPHTYRASNFVEQQQLLINDQQSRPPVARAPMGQQQPPLMRQHSIPPMSGQQSMPMAHHSNQLPPPTHHSQLAPVGSPVYLQATRQVAQPQPPQPAQPKQQTRAAEQVQQQLLQPMILPVYRCLKCGLEADQKCSGCQNTYYCSRECQVSHWDEHAKNCTSQ